MFSFRKLFSYLFARQPSMKDLVPDEQDLASPQNTSVNDYLASLTRYASGLDDPHEWLAQHKVSEISLRKCPDPPEHELIVAHVAFPVSGLSAKDGLGESDKPPVNIAFRLERTVADGKSAPTTKTDTGKLEAGTSAGTYYLKKIFQSKHPKEPTSANLVMEGSNSILDNVSLVSAASLNAASSSSIPGYKREANDAISGILATMLNEKDVAVGLFRPADMNILHFAVLAKLIHSKATEYTLFRKNCYWYAFHVYATALLEHGTVDDDEHLTATLSILEGVNAAVEETWVDVAADVTDETCVDGPEETYEVDVPKEIWAGAEVPEEVWVVVTEETVRNASAPQSSGTTRAAKRLSREAGRFMGFKLSKEDATKFREDYRQAIREEIEIVNAPGHTRQVEAEIERLKAQIRAMEELHAHEAAPAPGA